MSRWNSFQKRIHFRKQLDLGQPRMNENKPAEDKDSGYWCRDVIAANRLAA
jgi:hypothetical protein